MTNRKKETIFFKILMAPQKYMSPNFITKTRCTLSKLRSGYSTHIAIGTPNLTYHRELMGESRRSCQISAAYHITPRNGSFSRFSPINKNCPLEPGMEFHSVLRTPKNLAPRTGFITKSKSPS